MAGNQDELMRNLLSRAHALENRCNVNRTSTKTVQGRKNVTASTKTRSSVRGRTTDGAAKVQKTCSNTKSQGFGKDKSNHIKRNGTSRNGQLFRSVMFSSSEDETSTEISSICGACDGKKLTDINAKDGSMSIAFSVDSVSSQQRETDPEISSDFVSATPEKVGFPSVPGLLTADDVLFCPDSQPPSSRDASVIIDRLWHEHHPSINAEDTVDSENLSDILRIKSPDVIPASQNSSDESQEVLLCSGVDAVVELKESDDQNREKPSQVLPQFTGMPLKTRNCNSPQIETFRSPFINNSRLSMKSDASGLAANPARQGKESFCTSETSVMEQSALMLFQRLDEITNNDHRKHTVFRKRAAIASTCETQSHNTREKVKPKLTKIKKHKVVKVSEKICVPMDFSSEEEAPSKVTDGGSTGKCLSTIVMLNNESVTSTKSPRNKLKLSTKKRRQDRPAVSTVTMVTKHLSEAVDFTSEEDASMECKPSPHKQDHGQKTVDSGCGSSKKARSAHVKVKANILKSVDFSSEDESPVQTKDDRPQKPQEDDLERPCHGNHSNSSLTDDVQQDTDISSVSSSKADEDIALLSARFDSILCVSKAPSEKSKKLIKKTALRKKKVPVRSLPDIFSSTEDEPVSDFGDPAEGDAVFSADQCQPVCDTHRRNISLQVSIASTPDSCDADRQCRTPVACLTMAESPTAFQNPCQHKVTNLSGSSCKSAQSINGASPMDTTDKSLQVSFASQRSNSSPCDQREINPTFPLLEPPKAEDKTKYRTPSESCGYEDTSPPFTRNFSLQVSMCSQDESIDDGINLVHSDITKKCQSDSSIQAGSSEISGTSGHLSSRITDESVVPDESVVQDENAMYKTALTEASDSPEDELYKTVAEFTSFEEAANSPYLRDNGNQSHETKYAVRTRRENRRRSEHGMRDNPTLISDSDISDKENCRPSSDSDSDDVVHSKLITSSDDESSQENFVIADSESENEQAMNRQLGIKGKSNPTKRSVIHKITFSSDEEVDKNFVGSDLEEQAPTSKPVRLNLRKKRVVKESLSRAVMRSDELYDSELPDLPKAEARKSSVQFLVSDSSEEDLESFFTKMKTPRTKVKQGLSESLDDFIVDDDEVSSDENESIFYVQTDQVLSTKRKPRSRTPRAPSPYMSEDDTDEVVVIHDSAFKTPVAPPVKLKSYTSKPVQKTYRTPGSIYSTPGREAANYVKGLQSQHNSRQYSFLKSLSSNMSADKCHLEATKYVSNFKKMKEALTKRLFKMYNSTVFENKLPDDLPVEWNTRLTKTAGYCTYKKIKGATEQRSARIELSVKVCDSAERVRDTLIHELCHAAVWLMYGKTDGHGPYWKHWAQKANQIHPELPVISRCHSYQIQTKYTYRCTKCGYKIGRHSKSLNTDQKLCGYCHSPFELLVNTKSGLQSTPQTPRTPNRFALFVKDNYGSIKKQHTKISHKDVMQKLSADFALKSKLSG